MRIHVRLIAIVAALALLIGAFPVPSLAAGIVGDGTPGSCTDSAFAAALAGGGSVTFNCGPLPLTIPITTKVIAGGQTTIVDGGAKITLDGGGTLQHFLVEFGGDLTLQNISLTNGNFANGGAIYNQGTLALTAVTISNSRADSNGGAIYNTGALTVQSSSLENNQATLGGAIYSGGIATIADSSVIANRAASGAGLYQYLGQTDVARSLLMGNDATSFGGAIYNGHTAGTVTLTNVTLAGNSSVTAGGIYNNGTISLLNVTASGNRADLGGALWQNSGVIGAQNTILAHSLDRAGTSPSLNCDGSAFPVASAGNNISSDGSCGLIQPGDRSSTDPLLGPLQNYGGPTSTIMPLAGSPAIDAGSACPPTDQRGATRPAGSACDIGAVEYGATILLYTYLPYITR